jgi:tRNA pseudouridine55 synthase
VEADVHFADFEIEVDCSSGTYIRALARDLGQALSVGGHLTNLRRTRIADYSVTQAQSLDAIETLNILPLVDAARALFPAVELTEEQERDLIHGKRIQRGEHQARYLAGITKRNTLLAILEPSGNQLKSVVVFPEDKND